MILHKVMRNLNTIKYITTT